MEENQVERKRLALLFSVGALVAVLVTLAVVFLLGDDPDAPQEPKSYSLTAEDEEAATTTASLFVTDAGTFGVRPSAVTPNSILTLKESISTTPSADTFLSRKTVYPSLRTNYIAEDSSLVKNSVQDWSDAKLIANLTGAEAKAVKATVAGDGYMVGNQPAVALNVSFTSHQISRFQTANDTTWDGTYDVLEVDVPASFKLIMVKNTAGVWKVNDVQNLNYPSLLALGPIDSEERLPEPAKTGTIKTSVVLPGPNG